VFYEDLDANVFINKLETSK